MFKWFCSGNRDFETFTAGADWLPWRPSVGSSQGAPCRYTHKRARVYLRAFTFLNYLFTLYSPRYMAVSYTHLDVYKRQVLSLRLKNHP